MLTEDKDLERYLPQILEQSKNGIIVSDPNKEGNPVVYVNKRVCEIFGYNKTEFLGRNCSFLQGDDRDQEGIRLISEAIKNKESITTTLRNYTKNGKLVHNQFTISPIFDDKGKIKYFWGVQRDVTNEIILKEENEALQEEQIDNAQYSAIGKLSAGLSHEINTPLTIINGNMEMLKSSVDSMDDSSDKKYMLEDLEMIQNNLNRIKNITESMREIADSNYFRIEDINLFRAIIISLRLTHNKAKHITKIKLPDDRLFDLDIDRDQEKFMIKADYKKLEQAFISIIDNALDQLQSKGDPDKNLLIIDIIENSDYYEVVFIDNGGGIEPEILKDIFKPFKSNKEHRGLGIGLSIVKKILDEHQFNIKIENFNEGAKVTIVIPKIKV